MLTDERAQARDICRRRDSFKFNQFRIASLLELSIFVQHVGSAACHAGTEVASRFAENDDGSRRHILASVVPHTFHDCGGTAVSDTEPFAGYPCGVECAAGRAVKHRVPDDGVFMRTEPRLFIRADDDFTACQPFPDIVVRLACQPKVHPVATEGTETLPGTAREMTANRPVR